MRSAWVFSLPVRYQTALSVELRVLNVQPTAEASLGFLSTGIYWLNPVVFIQKDTVWVLAEPATVPAEIHWVDPSKVCPLPTTALTCEPATMAVPLPW